MNESIHRRQTKAKNEDKLFPNELYQFLKTIYVLVTINYFTRISNGYFWLTPIRNNSLFLSPTFSRRKREKDGSQNIIN